MKLARAATITSILLEEGLGYLTGKEPEEKPPPEAEAAVRLRKTLERLGPTFVKFGQMLATRVDLFSEVFTDELGKLHASVEPFPTEQARVILEEELGRPLDEVFADFPDAPVAAASIAQVYRATLRSGEQVAVKVQRPDLDAQLLSDLDTLLVLSGFIDRLVPPYRAAMVDRVAREYAARARSELDFLAEARAMERFGDVFRTLPEFRAPTLYRSLCSPRMLVMEWIDGTRLADVPGPEELLALGFEPSSFGRSMLRLQVCMSYEHGFLHGDTHPGNLILEPDGRVVLIDYGLHAALSRALREKMLEMVFAQASGETDTAVEAFIQVFKPDPSKDIEAFKAELRELLSVEGVEGGIRENRVTANLVAGMRLGARYNAQAQSELFTVIRNLTIVEGIVIRYAPDLDPNEELKHITSAILRRRLFGPSMQEELLQLLPQLALTLSQRPRLAKRLMKLERAFNASVTLGEFLRAEHVLQEAAPQPHPASYVIVALLGILIGLLIGLSL
ncbi:MAG: AarF/UbiB family protein [Myxococcota bacterium]